MFAYYLTDARVPVPLKDSHVTKEAWLASSAIVQINLKTQIQLWLRDDNVHKSEKNLTVLTAVSELTMVFYLQNLLYYKFLWQMLDTECTVFLIL